MLSRDSNSGDIAGLYQLIAEIVRDVTQAEVSQLPELLLKIVGAVQSAAGIPDISVSLLDYVFNDAYIASPLAAPLRRKVSQDLQAPDFSNFVALNKQAEMSSDGFSLSDGDINFPIASGSRQFGFLSVTSKEVPLYVGKELRGGIATLSGLAAIAIDRRRRHRDSLRLREWLDALGSIFAASRIPSGEKDVDRLLETIAYKALSVSSADFVVLYEYLNEINDVRLPPILAGSPREPYVMSRRGVEVEHHDSVLFRLLKKKLPFFAERAPEDWIDACFLQDQDGRRERSFFQREGIISSVGIPLQVDEECVGLLFLNYRDAQSFTQDFRDHISLFSKCAALAIGNVRLLLRTRMHIRNMEVLNTIGRDLGSVATRDPRQMGELIFNSTKSVIPTKNFFLCTYEAKDDKLHLAYLQDEHDTVETLQPNLNSGLAAYVCRSRLPLFARKEQQIEIFKADKARLVGQPSAVWLGSPLILRDEVVGALVVQDYNEETVFTQEHFALLNAIASQTAIAMSNYALLDETQLQLKELSALLEISNAFSSGRLTAPNLLSSILNHICDSADCTGSLLILIYPDIEPRLKVVAASSGMEKYLGKFLKMGEGVSGKVAETGAEWIENNYPSWPGRSALFDPPPQRVCAVPLVLHGSRIGVVTLSSDQERGDFSQREVEVLKRFAGPIAAAVQNARESSFRNALIHAGPNAIVAASITGEITEFNEEASEIFGFSKEDLKGKKASRLYWGGVRDARSVQSQLEKDGKVRERQVFGRTKDNKKVPISIAAAILRDETGEFIGSVGILQDLRLQSLRGRTQLLVEAIQEIGQEENLDRIIDNIILHAVELLYADAGCLLLRDEEMFRIQGAYRVEDNFVQALQAGISHKRLEDIASAASPGVIFLAGIESEAELKLVSDALSAVIVPLRTDTRLLGFLVLASRALGHFSADQGWLEILASQATVSINRVQLLKYKEETREGLLVAANAVTIGQIATSFIHEAKNSLNGMTLTIHNLIDEIRGEAHLKRKKNYTDRLSVVLSEMQRLDDLSRRLQRFTRQGLLPEKKDIYINDLIANTLQVLGSVLGKKQMRFVMRLDPRLDNPSGQGRGLPVEVDESQIQQVLINLILNAVAASPDRSPLAIETRSDEKFFEIRIVDHGEGISEKVKKKLFTPFFTTKKDGVGLGLYISKLLIEENHGGSIEIINSTPGKGTTLAVRLPRSY